MDESNYSHIVSGKYAEELYNLVGSVIKKKFEYIFMVTCNSFEIEKEKIDGKEQSKNVLILFQNNLAKINKWNKQKKMEEYRDIKKMGVDSEILKMLINGFNTSFLNEFISSLKFKVNMENINYKASSNPKFIFDCYKNIARELWKKPYLLVRNIPEKKINVFLQEFREIISKAIILSITDRLPFKEILENRTNENNLNDILNGGKKSEIVLGTKGSFSENESKNKIGNNNKNTGENKTYEQIEKIKNKNKDKSNEKGEKSSEKGEKSSEKGEKSSEKGEKSSGSDDQELSQSSNDDNEFNLRHEARATEKNYTQEKISSSNKRRDDKRSDDKQSDDKQSDDKRSGNNSKEEAGGDKKEENDKRSGDTTDKNNYKEYSTKNSNVKGVKSISGSNGGSNGDSNKRKKGAIFFRKRSMSSEELSGEQSKESENKKISDDFRNPFEILLNDELNNKKNKQSKGSKGIIPFKQEAEDEDEDEKEESSHGKIQKTKANKRSEKPEADKRSGTKELELKDDKIGHVADSNENKKNTDGNNSENNFNKELEIECEQNDNDKEVGEKPKTDKQKQRKKR
jgi:hypothetical protein